MRDQHNGKALPVEEEYEGFAPAGRRRARETAFLMLYQLGFGANDEQAAEQTLCSLNLDADNAVFARQLVNNARRHTAQSDKLIAAHSREWDFDRLLNIDVTILRLALGELNSDTPASIIINEAIELAKKFGDEKSPSFINAVLDAVYKKQPEETT